MRSPLCSLRLFSACAFGISSSFTCKNGEKHKHTNKQTNKQTQNKVCSRHSGTFNGPIENRTLFAGMYRELFFLGKVESKPYKTIFHYSTY